MEQTSLLQSVLILLEQVGLHIGQLFFTFMHLKRQPCFSSCLTVGHIISQILVLFGASFAGDIAEPERIDRYYVYPLRWLATSLYGVLLHQIHMSNPPVTNILLT